MPGWTLKTVWYHFSPCRSFLSRPYLGSLPWSLFPGLDATLATGTKLAVQLDDVRAQNIPV
jgi:hypothetical protein